MSFEDFFNDSIDLVIYKIITNIPYGYIITLGLNQLVTSIVNLTSVTQSHSQGPS